MTEREVVLSDLVVEFSTTGRHVEQLIPAPPGWCVTGHYEERHHSPVIAWALVRDHHAARTFTDESVVPVYVDDTPHVVWPSNERWENCEIVVHRDGECLSAWTAVMKIRDSGEPS